MAGWKKRAVGDLPLHQAATLSWLPDVVQGFTTRQGGVSKPPYDSLNLGTNTEDDADAVRDNRLRLYADLGFREDQIALAEQVHGNRVATVTEGDRSPVAGADALVTETPGVLLMLLFADCVPIYIVDPVGRAVGLAHSGWRGTVSNIVGETMRAMHEQFGCRPAACLAAIGPSIGGDSYEVGREVADRFRSLPNMRAGTFVYPKNEFTGTYTLNLRQVIYGQLFVAGFRADAIAVSDEDTFSNTREFFSYRRDGPQTGRMAAFLGLRARP